VLYIFDTNSFGELSHFYPSRFPSLWKSFDKLVAQGRVISVKEVLREINAGKADAADTIWANQNKSIFMPPGENEAHFITEIFKVEHFQQSLERKKLYKGGFFADPFIIASAKVRRGTVVTEEKFKEGGAKIPNICKRFQIQSVTLEGFMEIEGWQF
jgi:Domain of unknown function (DUF4411)